MERVIVAAVQATPVFMDREATVDRASERIAAAAKEKAKLIVFPETFVPGYPDWVWRAPAWEGPSGELFARLLENAVEIPGPATEALGKAARRAKAWVSIGVDERLSHFCRRILVRHKNLQDPLSGRVDSWPRIWMSINAGVNFKAIEAVDNGVRRILHKEICVVRYRLLISVEVNLGFH